MKVNSQISDRPVSAFLVCVCCGTALPESLTCDSCSRTYGKNRYGYLEMLKEPWDHVTAQEDYFGDQEHTGLRVFKEYLQPLLAKAHRYGSRCRLRDGQGIWQLDLSGSVAYGVDLPCYSPFWAKTGLDSTHFMCADACSLPFPANFFDVVYSLGVIEHIGTVSAHCTLRPDYWQKREAYAQELLRVTKPGGRIIIACPNKTFPVDIQHGPTDAVGPKAPLRSFISNKTGLNFHKTWGSHHLLSYRETRRLFPSCASFKALPLDGYFGFGKFQRGLLKPFASLAKWYVHSLPEALRASSLNPYMLVEIRK